MLKGIATYSQLFLDRHLGRMDMHPLLVPDFLFRLNEMETFGARRGAEEGIMSKSNKRFGKVAGQVYVDRAVLVQSWF